MAGDFNATAAHPAFRRFGDVGLRDAHREVGAGPVTTWPRFAFPGLAQLDGWFHIDHVLARGLAATDAGVVRIPGSDHDAVWAELASYGD
jgi:endonuclease/exonuclease/phosphatase (EEP) superfamily protein YafD